MNWTFRITVSNNYFNGCVFTDFDVLGNYVNCRVPLVNTEITLTSRLSIISITIINRFQNIWLIRSNQSTNWNHSRPILIQINNFIMIINQNLNLTRRNNTINTNNSNINKLSLTNLNVSYINLDFWYVGIYHCT